MNSVICTLFEGDYHYGVGALVNSHYAKGFKGDVYAGYRGVLPEWAKEAKENSGLSWNGATTLAVAEGLELHFLPLTTDYHLTNYKPDFMLDLLAGPAKDADAIFYFDPDIVQVAPWSFMEEWVNCGIAVCEDVNSPLEQYHPRRVYWRDYYQKYGVNLRFKSSVYVNGGFVGLAKKDFGFIGSWKEAQDQMADDIGGLSRSAFVKSAQLPESKSGDFYAFGKTDQDALNVAIEAYKEDCLAFLHKEAMGFENGVLILAHALGHNKPWNYRPFKMFFNGIVPRRVDRLFWQNVIYPMHVFNQEVVRKKNRRMKVISFLSRFYCKN